MKTTLTLIIALLITTTFNAQTEMTWLGGSIGQESDWNVASNWSNGEVPDEDSKVIINFLNSGHNAQPVITDEVTVASIEIRSMGMLTIETTGSLMIDGSTVYSEGISVYGGTVNNKGSIHFNNLGTELTAEQLIQFQGEGIVYLENENFKFLNQTALATGK